MKEAPTHSDPQVEIAQLRAAVERLTAALRERDAEILRLGEENKAQRLQVALYRQMAFGSRRDRLRTEPDNSPTLFDGLLKEAALAGAEAAERAAAEIGRAARRRSAAR